MWTAAEPVVRDWIERNFGPAGQLGQAADTLSSLGRLARQIPELAARAERLTADLDRLVGNGIRLHGETVQGIGEEVGRYGRSGRVALWVLALGVLAIGSALLVSVL
jgi:ubiquinone biosynthesis protein